MVCSDHIIDTFFIARPFLIQNSVLFIILTTSYLISFTIVCLIHAQVLQLLITPFLSYLIVQSISYLVKWEIISQKLFALMLYLVLSICLLLFFILLILSRILNYLQIIIMQEFVVDLISLDVGLCVELEVSSFSNLHSAMMMTLSQQQVLDKENTKLYLDLYQK